MSATTSPQDAIVGLYPAVPAATGISIRCRGSVFAQTERRAVCRRIRVVSLSLAAELARSHLHRAESARRQFDFLALPLISHRQSGGGHAEQRAARRAVRRWRGDRHWRDSSAVWPRTAAPGDSNGSSSSGASGRIKCKRRQPATRRYEQSQHRLLHASTQAAMPAAAFGMRLRVVPDRPRGWAIGGARSCPRAKNGENDSAWRRTGRADCRRRAVPIPASDRSVAMGGASGRTIPMGPSRSSTTITTYQRLVIRISICI